MYRPDYNPRKKMRASRIGPTILLGLIAVTLFGVFSGILPGGQFLDWWDWSPDAAHTPVEITTIGQVPSEVAITPDAPTPAPTAATLSQNSPMLAPDFVLSDLFDESLNRSLSGFSGQPVILNFWASWCVPCKEEMPALQRAYEEHRAEAEGLVVLGVNQTFIDDLDAARAFVNELTLTFPNVRDNTGNISEGLYQVVGLPTSVFITADGELAHKQIGQMSDQQIDTFSQQLVTGEAITP